MRTPLFLLTGFLLLAAFFILGKQFSSNYPAAMLLNLRVRDVGTFNYDADNWFSALSPVGQCN